MDDKVIYNGAVNDIVRNEYVGRWPNGETKLVLNKRKLLEYLPCVYIFSDYQLKDLTFLKKNIPEGAKLIYESEPAVNCNYPGSPPRNVLIILDKDEDKAVS